MAVKELEKVDTDAFISIPMTPDCDFVNDENGKENDVQLGVTSLIINDSNLINKMTNFTPIQQNQKKQEYHNLPYVYPQYNMGPFSG